MGASTTCVKERLVVTVHNLENKGWVVSKKLILKSPNKIKLARDGGLMYVHKTVRRLSKTQ